MPIVVRCRSETAAGIIHLLDTRGADVSIEVADAQDPVPQQEPLSKSEQQGEGEMVQSLWLSREPCNTTLQQGLALQAAGSAMDMSVGYSEPAYASGTCVIRSRHESFQ